jgi:hypothetical protein
VAGLGLLLAGCTGGSPAATPSVSGPSASGSPGANLCADLTEITTTLPPLFDRITAGTEPKQGFPTRIAKIDLLSRALYADAAPFATNGHDAEFALLTQLSTDMSHLVTQEFQEFPVTVPADVPPEAIAAVRADISQVKRAVVRGLIACGGVAN